MEGALVSNIPRRRDTEGRLPNNVYPNILVSLILQDIPHFGSTILIRQPGFGDGLSAQDSTQAVLIFELPCTILSSPAESFCAVERIIGWYSQ